MSRKHLYVNSTGWEVRTHSFSGGEEFRFCPEKYRLHRMSGWNERELSAARLFGLDLEAGIRFFHEHEQDISATVEYFQNRWGNAKELAIASEFSDETKQYLKDGGFKNFKPGYGVRYTQTEGSWAALRATGTELLRLRALRYKSWPIDLDCAQFKVQMRNNRAFQLQYRKELFPGTEWAGIEFVAYIDLLAPSRNSLSERGVDIKTAGQALDTTPGMLALDQQLRTYAWVTGIPDWAFDWNQKVGRTIEKGSKVTVLEGAGSSGPLIMFPGTEGIVAALDEGDEFAPGDFAWVVKGEPEIDAMCQAQGYKNEKLEQTKAAKERKLEWLKNNAARIPTTSLTKQRIQFVTAHIGLAEQQEAAQLVARDVAAIIQANEENFWPKLGSVRGMDKKCLNCQMRGICLNNSEVRDKLIFRTDDEWDNQED